jgi:hypothetical protein
VTEKIPRKYPRLEATIERAGKLVLGLLMASPPLLAWFGYQEGVSREHHNNQIAAEKVERLENCLRFLNAHANNGTIALVELPDEMRVACELPNTDPLVDSPLIVEPEDILVRVPLAESLDEKINSLEADASDFNTAVPLQYMTLFGGIGCAYALYGWISYEE